jgi:hypothetical protein
MAWAVGNARVEPKGNAITITKQASGTAKIDLLMAVQSCLDVGKPCNVHVGLPHADVRFRA